MTETTNFTCETCFDTRTVDSGGREVACPDCTVTVKLTGLGWGLGETGSRYATCTACSKSTITFTGTRDDIRRDVASVARADVVAARMRGRKGRNSISSGALAIERRVFDALRPKPGN